MIGATDSHSGLAAEEDNFWGKMALDSTPETKGLFGVGRVVDGWNIGAQGLAGVWAEENTREAILAAFRRREVYATTGPRMQVRFFGGWNFGKRDADAADLVERGYAKGVPMGGDLAGPPPEARGLGRLFGDAAEAPSFLIHAAKDPKSANLDRIQVVKVARGDMDEPRTSTTWRGPGIDRPVRTAPSRPSETRSISRRGPGPTKSARPSWSRLDRPPLRRESACLYYVRVLDRRRGIRS